MRSAEEFETVQGLIAAGMNDRDICEADRHTPQNDLGSALLRLAGAGASAGGIGALSDGT
ncbi:hypothetical protein BHQ20_08935 [Mycobacterium intermedium]|nr:hypothetical protein BHQ20_08935 [Mycobacterium intermedium]